MKIITVNHRFTGNLSKRTRTDEIVIHHQAGNPVPAATMHQWHLGRGWIGIGYHYVIQPDGTIETGRPIDTVGAHAGAGVNGRSIGVCFAGNMDQRPPTELQVQAFYDLYRQVIKPRYGKLKITGHREHMSTSCPGRHMPMDRIEREADGMTPKLRVDGRTIVAPVKNDGGRIYVLMEGENNRRNWVQIRALADLLGLKLEWTQATQTADMKTR